MESIYNKIVNDIYKILRDNMDIVNCWFETDGKFLDEERLFNFVKYEFNDVVGNEENIYIFFNKVINNILHGKSFSVKNLNYLEENFISLVNIIIEKYKECDIK